MYVKGFATGGQVGNINVSVSMIFSKRLGLACCVDVDGVGNILRAILFDSDGAC